MYGLCCSFVLIAHIHPHVTGAVFVWFHHILPVHLVAGLRQRASWAWVFYIDRLVWFHYVISDVAVDL